MKIRFRSIKAIGEFLDIVNRFSAEIDIKSKRTTVDGKSMMGIFSLDLSNPVEVTAIGNESDQVYEAISKYAA